MAAVETLDIAQAQPAKLAVLDKGLTLSTAEVIERTKRIREIMETVMKPNVHYGVIPGTQKPTMYQPGADVLNVTFRIAPKIAQVDDLSNTDEVRYRIIVQGLHQVTGEMLAEGIGECSSSEEKYRWRKVVCNEEFDETPNDHRREKWNKGSNNGKPWKAKQVRTSPADVANTVLKMAVKRAKVAMTISATAASDVFAQDLEDLSEELREHLAEDEQPKQPPPQPAQRVSQQTNGGSTTPPGSNQPTTEAPNTQPAQVPAAGGGPQNGKSPIGVIVAVKEQNGGARITLDSGFQCSTNKDELMTAAVKHRDTKRRVELVTTPSTDPTKYLPRLAEIQVMEAGA